MPYKSERRITPDRVIDPNFIPTIGYNAAAGAHKQLPIGPHLLPIFIVSGGVGSYTTNASAGVNLGAMGVELAVYNNSGSLASITISPAAASSLAAGVTDSVGNVGVACPPNAWTYVSCADSQFVITSASTLLVYIIDDDSYLTPNALTLAAISPT
jgi:hypothetical protein